MELFLQHLPVNQRQRTIERQIRQFIKRQFGTNIEVDLHIFRNRTIGALTFPSTDTARRFLAHTRLGLPIRDRSGRYRAVTIRESRNAANPRLVEGLNTLMAERQENSSGSELDVRTGNTFGGGGHVPITKIMWGVWISPGKFGLCGAIEKEGEMSYNSQSGELEMEFNEESGIVIKNIAIEEMFVGPSSTHCRIFLTLNRIPLFWSETGSIDPIAALVRDFELMETDEDESKKSKPRRRALSEEHSVDAPYCTVYVVEGPCSLSAVRRLMKSMRRGTPSQYSISTVNLNLGEGFDCLKRLYVQHHFTIAFQMESMFRNCVLIPSEIISLNEKINQLANELPREEVVQILQSFSARLPLRTFEETSAGIDLHNILDDTAHAYRNYHPNPEPNAAWIHRLDILPSSWNMDGPEWMGANRVLRLFPDHHDHFLKVSFAEEDLSTIRQNREYSLDRILYGAWSEALSEKSGVTLAGRTFYFLGFSQSSLKEHSAWFMSYFEHEGCIITPQFLHRDLGDFSKIRCPPRFAARLGQVFTTTSHSIKLDPKVEVVTMSDVEQRGHLFSDGVGTISQGLIERVWEASGIKEEDIKPVAYQVRLGGSKGVLSLDTKLNGNLIRLRPSMTKFEAENSHLELANQGKIIPFFLNKQLIAILETLGVKPQDFFRILQAELAHLELASTSYDDMVRLFRRHGLGQAPRLQSILRSLEDQGLNDILDIPFFNELRVLALAHALKQIKYKSRIAVDSSWKLLGVMDEFNYLREGQVYVCLREEQKEVRYLEGRTIVTRSPCLHCGDVQIVDAIGSVDPSHPLSALHNCIVFASTGHRPIPNMLSGGDLDGDLFDVSQHPSLFPPMCDAAAAYESVPPRELLRDCTIDDITKFFLGFILNDNLGQLCTRHAILADQSEFNVREEKCVELARLASIAVDFPKTGRSVDLRFAPKVKTHIQPDFMARRALLKEDYAPNPHGFYSPTVGHSGTRPDRKYFYRSERILGQLYRYVDIKSLLQSWNSDSRSNRESIAKLWVQIKENLEKLFPPYLNLWPEFVKEAEEIFETYVEDLKDIERRFHPRRWTNRRLSEAEVFLQCLAADPLTKTLSGRGKTDYLRTLRIEYGRLVDWAKLGLVETKEARYQRAAARFYVGSQSARRSGRAHGESFAWIMIPDLFKAWEWVEDNGYVDGED